jgi:hypothetical protein
MGFAMSSSLLSVARSYVGAGLSVIPVKGDGSKAPALDQWKQYQQRKPDDDELQTWFGDNGVGLAVVGGAVSGNLAVLDFETESAFSEWCRTVGAFGLEAVNGDPLAETPNGGRHLYLRIPTAAPNQKLAKDRTGKTKIEVKGEGGYVLAPGCPGCCHPTGKAYRWIREGWIA